MQAKPARTSSDAGTATAKDAVGSRADTASDRRPPRVIDSALQTVSSIGTDKQHRQQQPDRASNQRDRSRGREEDKPREPNRPTNKLGQQHSAGHRGMDGVGIRMATFTNPSYCPNPPPTDPAIKFWRGRDGYVHDRQGNKWDAKTKLLVAAGPSSEPAGAAAHASGWTAAAAAGDTRAQPRSSLTGSKGGRRSSPHSTSNKRQRRDSAAGTESTDARQQPQQQGLQPQRSSSHPVTAASPAAASPVAAGDGGGGATAGASGGGNGVASTPIASTPQGRAVGSTVLPEELDVDMEIEDLQELIKPQLPSPLANLGPALPSASPDAAVQASEGRAQIAALEPAGSKPQQRRSRQFGAAARRPPAAATAAVKGTVPAPASPATAVAAGVVAFDKDSSGGGGGGVSGSTSGSKTPPAVPMSSGPAASPRSAARSAAVVEAEQCNAEYQAVAREALQHNLSALDTASFKYVPGQRTMQILLLLHCLDSPPQIAAVCTPAAFTDSCLEARL